ncbi:YhfC family glutamic-type intramembrane protease [Anaerotignum sp.]|uniref:YhfC family glutamic-type intramembrane protease n=1 Tax=Anaerotignum sp. TaxID=2039241 RepID=UPI0028A178A1|nr:YhfC family glutamic-type intramembrane protease [Anaerotignum sp.]
MIVRFYLHNIDPLEIHVIGEGGQCEYTYFTYKFDMMYFLTVFGTFVLPFILAYYYWNKTTFFPSFRLGVVCFFLTQWIARPIFLQVVGCLYSPMFSLFESVNAIVLGAVSAGIFEEVRRYLCWKKFRKEIKPSFKDAIAFGIGHASLEAVGGIGLSHIMSWKNLYSLDISFRSMLIPLNRIMAGTCHVALTLIVFYGLRKKIAQKQFTFIAIACHFFLDFIGGMIIYQYDYKQTFWGFSWAIENEDAFMFIYISLVLICASLIIYLANKHFSKMEESESNQLSEEL